MTSRPSDQQAHTLFEAQAARTPAAPAVSFEGTTLSYAELDEAANRLADRLTAAPAAGERLVALALPRSPDQVVAILAVLKSGAAYLPLDPRQPADRLAHILRDAEPALVLTRKSEVDRLPVTDVPVLLVDDVPAGGTASAGAPTDRAPADRAAYVIYTSGSTGNPKGVVVTHANLTRLFEQCERWFSIGPHDVVPMFHAYNFDFSVWEFWGTLLRGGHLLLVPDRTTRNPRDLLAMLVEEGVTVLGQTPSAFHQLMSAVVDLPELAARLRLRTIVFCGEVLDFRRVAEWYRVRPAARPLLVNMYGPTEATVFATGLALDRSVVRDESVSLIGSALGDLVAHVLDERLAPVEPGGSGELYLSGPGLARGYLNQPALTAQRFVADPAGSGGRAYRTGDLVRLDHGGTLAFLGRADDQVKIRGFRVEPGEVGAVLRSRPDVRDAVVLARAAGSTEALRLVAYVVPADRDLPGSPGHSSFVDSVLDTARNRLPRYMIPSQVVLLKALPLNGNGKVDRKALLDTEESAGSTSPRTPVEDALCRLFADVLGLPAVDPGHGFYRLGGDSMALTRLVNAGRNAGLDLTPEEVDRVQTPTALAAALVARGATTSTDTVAHLPLTAWLAEDTDRVEPFGSVHEVDLESGVDERVVVAAVRSLVERHELLRASTSRGLRVAAAGEVDARGLVTRVDPADDRSRAEHVAQARARIGTESTVRVVWFDRGPHRTGSLALVVHPLLVDARTGRILREDLSSALTALTRGRAPQLEPAAPYREWMTALRGRTPAPPPGSGPPDPAAAGTRSVRERFTAAETGALEDRAQAWGCDLEVLVLTALAAALQGHLRTGPTVVDVEQDGRTEAYARTVGRMSTLRRMTLAPGTLAADTTPARAVRRVAEELRRSPAGGVHRSEAVVHFRYHGPCPDTAAEPPRVGARYALEVVVALAGNGPRPVLEVALARSGPESPDFAPREVGVLVRSALTLFSDRDLHPARESLSPADVPLVTVSQQDIDRFHSVISDVEGLSE
ncbi:amino acid adenylation domain-containing protein [Actinosynnema sp. NPDC020468]|uniref:amino acid adenylation domain-containing protein n=1 Tax=Actinosynnema sp. NPDC020468 TaxID=3154488 RepID=UPI003403319B